LTFGSDVALPNTGTRRDPVVGGIDELLDVRIGQDAFRQKAAGTRYARVNQSCIPDLERSKKPSRASRAEGTTR